MKKAISGSIALLVLAMLLQVVPVSANAVLRLATTTSTDNSGLLEVLLPVFEKRYGMQVHTIAVGTGKALRLGERGDVDVVMVHAKTAEEKFIADGFGVEREEFMFNHFLIVGPASDPAGVGDLRSAVQVLQKLESTQSLFLSRGDDSGTHMRELAIWELAGLSPSGDWYREAGQGMGKVLQIAGEFGAYTISDRGTWLKFRQRIELVELFSSDSPLYNPYSVIAVNPKRHPHVNHDGARSLVGWLNSTQAQSLIDSFRIENQRAFVPLHLE